VSKDLDQFKGLMVTTSALGTGHYGHVHEDFSALITNVTSTPVGERLQRRIDTLAAVVVIRWSKDLDVIFIMFGVLYTFCELKRRS
jgi:hypothetical protein